MQNPPAQTRNLNSKNAASSAFSNLLEPGRFLVGCNYWASHAGTRMWSDWRPKVILRDLDQLAEAGLRLLRVFPLWPDFQPIHLLRGYAGQPAEITDSNEIPLPEEEAAQHGGLSPTALDRFQFLADACAKRHLQLLVGLITGWMSSRLFVPSALEGLNPLTSSLAIRWQIRFARAFVRHFRHHPAIAGWDLGNECNCMGTVSSPHEAWCWTSHLVNAIRSEDLSRPILSGMHSLSVHEEGPWTILDQAELTDILTVHPYPLFTPHCDQDPLDTLRPTLHAAAESLLYSGIGRKPCCVEEIGTLGPMLGSEEQAAAYARTVLFSLWSCDTRAFLWWCAYDQNRLGFAPYRWSALERELGLFRSNRRPKPVLHELSRFSRWLETLPFQTLPPRLTEAVCLLTHGQDSWGAAYSAMILARQAHFDLVFRKADQRLPDASLYLLPSLSGASPLPQQAWETLLDRVANGAILYLSIHDAFLSSFQDALGLQINSRFKTPAPLQIRLLSEPPTDPPFTVPATYGYELAIPGSARILAEDQEKRPLYVQIPFGKGQMFFLTFPLEIQLASVPGCFHRPTAPPFWKLYAAFTPWLRRERLLHALPPEIGATEHPLDRSSRVLVLVNHSPATREFSFLLPHSWKIQQILYGHPPSGERLCIEKNDAAVFIIERGRHTQ